MFCDKLLRQVCWCDALLPGSHSQPHFLLRGQFYLKCHRISPFLTAVALSFREAGTLGWGRGYGILPVPRADKHAEAMHYAASCISAALVPATPAARGGRSAPCACRRCER